MLNHKYLVLYIILLFSTGWLQAIDYVKVKNVAKNDTIYAIVYYRQVTAKLYKGAKIVQIKPGKTKRVHIPKWWFGHSRVLFVNKDKSLLKKKISATEKIRHFTGKTISVSRSWFIADYCWYKGGMLLKR